MPVPAATLSVSGAKILIVRGYLASASVMPPYWLTSKQRKLQAKINMASRESGESFKPMECAFGKNGFGGS